MSPMDDHLTPAAHLPPVLLDSYQATTRESVSPAPPVLLLMASPGSEQHLHSELDDPRIGGRQDPAEVRTRSDGRVRVLEIGVVQRVECLGAQLQAPAPG